MAKKESFQATGRFRLPLMLGAVVAAGALTMMMGVVAPMQQSSADDELRAGIVSDFYRIEHAAAAYLADNDAFPGPAFDLSDTYDGGLCTRTAAPPHQQGTWKGPYLRPVPLRPTPQSFWSMAEPQTRLDADHDGQADELWVRLHRGYGEIDEATARWLDRVLDDGQPGVGAVQVTETWIWFKLLER